MTHEQKQKLEQAADALFEHKDYTFTPCDYATRKGFLQGAQTILENPHEYGLTDESQCLKEVAAKAKFIHHQNKLIAKYRKALERIAKIYDPLNQAVKIAKEALKQQ